MDRVLIESKQAASRSLRDAPPFLSRLALLGPLVCAIGLACADGGKKATEPDPPSPGEKPRIDRLIPSRTVAADTVRVEGSNFGEVAADAEVTFTGGSGRIVAPTLGWSDSAITVLVPEGTVNGVVSVQTSAGEGNGKAFSIAPSRVLFSTGLLPLLNAKGCVDCHSGDFATNNLRLESVPDILRGDSAHGPAVIRRNGPASLIVRKVSADPPFGQRMPLGCTGACMSEEQILAISDWIDQGARND
jgi:hypothetical protein